MTYPVFNASPTIATNQKSIRAPHNLTTANSEQRDHATCPFVSTCPHDAECRPEENFFNPPSAGTGASAVGIGPAASAETFFSDDRFADSDAGMETPSEIFLSQPKTATNLAQNPNLPLSFAFLDLILPMQETLGDSGSASVDLGKSRMGGGRLHRRREEGLQSWAESGRLGRPMMKRLDLKRLELELEVLVVRFGRIAPPPLVDWMWWRTPAWRSTQSISSSTGTRNDSAGLSCAGSICVSQAIFRPLPIRNRVSRSTCGIWYVRERDRERERRFGLGVRKSELGEKGFWSREFKEGGRTFGGFVLFLLFSIVFLIIL